MLEANYGISLEDCRRQGKSAYGGRGQHTGECVDARCIWQTLECGFQDKILEKSQHLIEGWKDSPEDALKNSATRKLFLDGHLTR